MMGLTQKAGKKLLRRCLLGDNAAWEIFVDTYHPVVFRAIETTLVRQGVEPVRPLVEHLFHHAFDILMENECQRLRQFRWKCELSNWLYLMAMRLTLEHVQQHPLLETNFREAPEDQAWSSKQNHRQLASNDIDLRQEEWQCYKELKTTLTPREQLFLRWYYELDLPLIEVADLIGVPVNKIAALKQQVREKMKPCIKRLL